MSALIESVVICRTMKLPGGPTTMTSLKRNYPLTAYTLLDFMTVTFE